MDERFVVRNNPLLAIVSLAIGAGFFAGAFFIPREKGFFVPAALFGTVFLLLAFLVGNVSIEVDGSTIILFSGWRRQRIECEAITRISLERLQAMNGVAPHPLRIDYREQGGERSFRMQARWLPIAGLRRVFQRIAERAASVELNHLAEQVRSGTLASFR
jgi:hypothetical protein